MRIGIAADHGGFALKNAIASKLRSSGHEVVDFGAHALDLADDYPDFVIPWRDRSPRARSSAGSRSAAAGSAPASPPTRLPAFAPDLSTTCSRPGRASKTTT